MPSPVTVIGLSAAFCTTVSYIPQLKKVWQTGSTEDISLKFSSSAPASRCGCSLRCAQERRCDHPGQCHEPRAAAGYPVLQAAEPHPVEGNLAAVPVPGVDNAVRTAHIAVMPQAQKSPADTADPRPLRKGDHVFLIDGSSYIFRAYFAMFAAAQKSGKKLTRSDGLPIGGVLAFSNMLFKLLREGFNGVKPTHVAVVFDHSEKTFRNEIYPDYKGHRPDPPDELIPQFPLMRDAVRAFGLIPVEQPGYEADDIIATYARQAVEAGADATIVAGDKDLMQLVRPGISMFDPMPGRERPIGREEVIEKFGVPPEKVVEVQSLIGDSTDNVPGVPGIGVKTAALLINEFGDLETLLARASEIKQEKRRQSLIDFAEQARMSKRLVLLDDQVTIDCPIHRLCLD